MQRWVVLTIVTACGQPAVSPRVTTSAPASPAPPTCAEIGVILRGDINVDDGKAGPAREQAIQSACEQDRWAADVIRCAGSKPHPSECLTRLTDEQRKGFDARMTTWSQTYDATAIVTEPDDGLSCAEALHNADAMRPVLDDASPERTWQSEQRTDYLVNECERHGWNDVARACLAIATTADAIDGCLTSELDPAKLDVMQKRLDEVARDAKAIATLRKAKAGCTHVVNAHYADKKWQGRGKPAERKQSRNALLLACKNEKWDEFRRACMIVGRSDCAEDLRWGYPSISVACSDYALAIERVGRCTMLPAQTRDALKQAFDAARMATVPDEACTAAAAAVSDVLRSSGC